MLKVMHNFVEKINPIYIYIGAALITLLLSNFILISPTSALYSGTFDANVKVRPSLTLNITSSGIATSNVVLNLDPASNPYDSKELNITVGTNNQTGYVLTMSTANGSSNLVNVADNTKIIPTLSQAAGSTPASLSDNTWGYKKDTGNYIPFASTTILSNNTRTNEDSTTLTFAAKVDYTKPSGLYEQDLVFTATPNMVTYYMQDLDPAVCSKDPIEAIDLRDGNTYWVAELDDGNCWMLQNLQLGNTLATTSGSMTLTPDDSNVSQNWTLTNKIPSPGNMPSTTITDDVSGSNSAIYNNNAFYCAPDGTNQYKSCYYNWYTATAGSGTSNVTGKDTTGVDVNESICPSGWVLPKGGSDSTTNNFSILYSYYPSATQILVDPVTATDNINGANKPGFLLSGVYNNSGGATMGERGIYWTRTAFSNARGYFLFINGTTSVSPQYYNDKDTGRSVRCLRETRKIYDIDNMQDMSPAIASNTNIGSATTLTDTRDNNEYTVAKLKDGKVWMTQNLRLGTNSSSVTLTPMDSNITASSWTLNGKVAAPGVFTSVSCGVGNCEDRYSGVTYYNNSDAYYCTPDSTNNYVGCYYNWYTATAGAGIGGDNPGTITPVGTSVGYKDVSSSICPKGWYLPSGGGVPLSGSTDDRPNSDFNVLYNNYSSTSELLVEPVTAYNNTSGLPRPGLLLVGAATVSGIGNVGKYGGYWSRSAYSKGTAYSFTLGNSEIYPQTINYKYLGQPVRCLAY